MAREDRRVRGFFCLFWKVYVGAKIQLRSASFLGKWLFYQLLTGIAFYFFGPLLALLPSGHALRSGDVTHRLGRDPAGVFCKVSRRGVV
jgi:hypothetical protein